MNSIEVRFSNGIKSFLLYTIVTLLFLQFLKDLFPIYYVIVGFFIILSIIILIFEANLSIFKINYVSTLYLLLFLLICVSSIFSLRYFDFPLAYSTQSVSNQDNAVFMSYSAIAFSIAKMLIMPAFVLYSSHLIINQKQLDRLVFIFVIFVCLAAFSLIFQAIFGHMPIFGAPNADRFIGFTPYSSSIGAVTTYATAFSFASIMIMLHFENTNFSIKLIILTILLVGAVASMGKAAIVNIFLVVAILIIFLQSKERIYFSIYLFLALIGTIIISPLFFTSVASLIGNTFGLEIIDNSIHRGIYKPFYERVLDRVTGRNWLQDLNYVWELMLGWGTLGGGGAFGLMVDTSDYNAVTAGERYSMYGWEKIVNTTHNQYIDLFQIGGVPLIFVFVLLLITVQVYLFKEYLVKRTSFSRALFISNTIFIINGLVFNGIVFQPYLSFIFWMSIIYFVRFKN